jgi:DNA-directed RNA polymerase specialized sigma24 family protein
LNFKEIEDLYNQNKDFLFRKFLFLTRNSDQAYDLIQSVFLKILEYSQKREFSSINRSFLIKVGYNIFLTEYNKSKKDLKRDLNFTENNRKEMDQTIETDYENFSRKVINVIDELKVSNRVKISLRLRLLGEEDIKTISEVNQVSYRTTLRDLKNGFPLLKEKLQKKRI